MSPTRPGEARGHHFVPKCWLAGFTDTGQNDGRLWVTDFELQKQFPSTPSDVGRRRDFNRIENPEAGEDPLEIENMFAKLESDVAPLLRSLYNDSSRIRIEDLHFLLLFIAIQWTRTPSFRTWVLEVGKGIWRKEIGKTLASPEAWTAFLTSIGESLDRPSADYGSSLQWFKDVVSTDRFEVEAATEWYLKRGLDYVPGTHASLLERKWTPARSPKGNFIALDAPVLFDGREAQIGFKNAEVILYPVNRRLLICGTYAPTVADANRWFIARQNTFAMISAERQVFSHVPDFVWLDENSECQTDWQLFSKERMLAAIKDGAKGFDRSFLTTYERSAAHR